MSRRTVLRGGYVLTLDDELGELVSGDVLIEDDRIAAVARSVDASDSEVVDVRGVCRDARLRRHPPSHVADGVPGSCGGLNARAVRACHQAEDIAELRPGRSVRRHATWRPRSTRRGRDDAAGFLTLDHDARARRRGATRPS